MSSAQSQLEWFACGYMPKRRKAGHVDLLEVEHETEVAAERPKPIDGPPSINVFPGQGTAPADSELSETSAPEFSAEGPSDSEPLKEKKPSKQLEKKKQKQKAVKITKDFLDDSSSSEGLTSRQKAKKFKYKKRWTKVLAETSSEESSSEEEQNPQQTSRMKKNKERLAELKRDANTEVVKEALLSKQEEDSCSCNKNGKKVHFDEEKLIRAEFKRLERKQRKQQIESSDDEDMCICICRGCQKVNFEWREKKEEIRSGRMKAPQEQQNERPQSNQGRPRGQTNQNNEVYQHNMKSNIKHGKQNIRQSNQHQPGNQDANGLNNGKRDNASNPIFNNSPPPSTAQQNSTSTPPQSPSDQLRFNSQPPLTNHFLTVQQRQLSERLRKARQDLDHLRGNNMSRLLRTTEGVVVIREDVIESPGSDPRPNAFYDSRAGVIRVYHGQLWGNESASLAPLQPSTFPVGNLPGQAFMPPLSDMYGAMGGLGVQMGQMGLNGMGMNGLNMGGMYGTPPYGLSLPNGYVPPQWNNQGYNMGNANTVHEHSNGMDSSSTSSEEVCAHHSSKANKHRRDRGSGHFSKHEEKKTRDVRGQKEKDKVHGHEDKNRTKKIPGYRWVKVSDDEKKEQPATTSGWPTGDTAEKVPESGSDWADGLTDKFTERNNASTSYKPDKSSWLGNSDKSSAWTNNDVDKESSEDSSKNSSNNSSWPADAPGTSSWDNDAAKSEISIGSWADGKGPTTGKADDSWGSPPAESSWGNQNAASSTSGWNEEDKKGASVAQPDPSW